MASVILALTGTQASAGDADWPHWGGTLSTGSGRRSGTDGRNMVWAGSAHLPESFNPGVKKWDGSGIDMSPSEDLGTGTTGNVKWAVRLGTQTYGNPTVSGGKVFVGTNNGARRNDARRGDRGALMCFKEDTGEFLWQLVVSK